MTQVYQPKNFLCWGTAWLSSGCPAPESNGGGGSMNVSHPLGFLNYFTEYCVSSVWANEAKPEYRGVGLPQPWLLQLVSLSLSMREFIP